MVLIGGEYDKVLIDCDSIGVVDERIGEVDENGNVALDIAGTATSPELPIVTLVPLPKLPEPVIDANDLDDVSIDANVIVDVVAGKLGELVIDENNRCDKQGTVEIDIEREVPIGEVVGIVEKGIVGKDMGTYVSGRQLVASEGSAPTWTGTQCWPDSPRSFSETRFGFGPCSLASSSVSGAPAASSVHRADLTTDAEAPTSKPVSSPSST